LFHAYLRTITAALSARAQTKTIAYLTCWHTGTFGDKLRTIEAENP